MIFQIIDDKKECRGYFADGKTRLNHYLNQSLVLGTGQS